VEPTSATAGQPIRVHGPAFAGEPTVRVRVDGALVAEARAVAAPDCTYDLAFAAPAAPGPHSLTIELDPPARIEPPFDITVTAS
jgi:hypothetical protein